MGTRHLQARTCPQPSSKSCRADGKSSFSRQDKTESHICGEADEFLTASKMAFIGRTDCVSDESERLNACGGADKSRVGAVRGPGGLPPPSLLYCIWRERRTSCYSLCFALIKSVLWIRQRLCKYSGVWAVAALPSVTLRVRVCVCVACWTSILMCDTSVLRLA